MSVAREAARRMVKRLRDRSKYLSCISPESIMSEAADFIERALLAVPSPSPAPPSDIREALEPLNEQLLNLARHLVENPKPLQSPTQVRQLCRELLKAAAPYRVAHHDLTNIREDLLQ